MEKIISTLKVKELMNTKLIKDQGCLLCGSPKEARDVIMNLAKLKIKISEIPSKEMDRKEMGYGVVRLDISNVPRGFWEEIINMAC